MFLAACSSESTGLGGPGISVVSGPPPDTVQAVTSAPLVVAVSDGNNPVVGTTVAFQGVGVQVAAPIGPFGSSVALVTDSQGRVAVNVRLGAVAGSHGIVVSVPTMALVDTIEVVTQPGAETRMCVNPPDTVALIGRTVAFSATRGDRFCNATSGALPVTKVSGPIDPVATGFTGTALGVGRVAATSGAFSDTSTMRVIPDGQLAITDGAAAWLTRTDGSQSQTLSFSVPAVQEASISWNAAGSRVVVGGANGFRVFDLATNTTSPTAWPGGLAGSNVLWPRFGPGGVIYYSSAAGGGDWDLRRANADGTSASILIPTTRFPGRDFFPDWAPNGSRVVFTSDWEEYSKFVLRVMDATLTDTMTVDVEGSTPIWSPDGALIAYVELGLVGVVSPDLGVNRSWSLGWRKGVTWSPAGDMLVGIDETGTIGMVHVVSGASVMLEHLGSGRDAVAWRPINALAP